MWRHFTLCIPWRKTHYQHWPRQCGFLHLQLISSRVCSALTRDGRASRRFTFGLTNRNGQIASTRLLRNDHETIIKLEASTGTVHTSAKVCLTGVAIRIAHPDLYPDPWSGSPSKFGGGNEHGQTEVETHLFRQVYGHRCDISVSITYLRYLLKTF